MPNTDTIKTLLAQFRRYTGSGNMIRANQIMAAIVEEIIDVIQTSHAAAQDDPEAVGDPEDRYLIMAPNGAGEMPEAGDNGMVDDVYTEVKEAQVREPIERESSTDYDGRNPNLTDDDVEAWERAVNHHDQQYPDVEPPTADAAIMPDSPIVDAEQAPEPLPENDAPVRADEGWTLPERKLITDEVVERATRAEEEATSVATVEELAPAAPSETAAMFALPETDPTEHRQKPAVSKSRKSK